MFQFWLSLFYFAIFCSFVSSQASENEYFVIHRYFHYGNLTAMGNQLANDLRRRISFLENPIPLGLPTEKVLHYNPIMDFQRAVENTDSYVHKVTWESLVKLELLNNRTMKNWFTELESIALTPPKKNGYVQAFPPKSSSPNTYMKKHPSIEWDMGDFASDIVTIVVSPSSFKAKKVAKHLQKLDKESSYNFAASTLQGQSQKLLLEYLDISATMTFYLNGFLSNEVQHLSPRILPKDELAQILEKLKTYLEANNMETNVTATSAYAERNVKITRTWSVMDQIVDINILIPIAQKNSDVTNQGQDVNPEYLSISLVSLVGGFQIMLAVIIWCLWKKVHKLSSLAKKERRIELNKLAEGSILG